MFPSNGLSSVLPRTAMLAVAATTTSSLANPPAQIPVTGIVRDFKREHVDFNVTPVGGNGHFASMVGLTSTSDQRPVFAGGSFKVNAQWRDMDSHNIPPHLFSASGVLILGNGITYNPSNASMDTWDSNAGPYGGSNVGPAPPVQTGGPMPVITPPTGLPIVGAKNYSVPNSTHWINSSFQCPSVSSDQKVTIRVSGHQTIYCTGSFILAKENKVFIEPNSSLKLYVGGLFKISQSTIFNMVDATITGNPADVKLYALSSLNPGIHLNQSSKLCAQVFAPNCTMQMDQNDHFYGTFWGLGVNMDQGCGFHFDGMPQTVCGVTLNDSEGIAGVSSTGGVTSAATFNQWYLDTLGANLSAQHTIVLTRNGSGIYEYQNTSFFPIDGMLFGNEGDPHNFYFTYTFSVPFVHRACENRFFEFEGADDAWVFIDNKLAMDLGGVLPGVNQYVPIDRMELADGETYTLRLFYAQRNPSVASFNVRTNLDLIVPTPSATVSASWD